ncbi:peptidoglycan recognition family protein [Haloferula chungangensis]|uniref:Peptidoglycan recognition family protein n=1 Tax=Haloferula chungangensis TaxID=1048331 RepID=A0ABW2LB34_9BACT
MAFENVGKVWTPTSLEEYLATRAVPGWIDSLTIHHTAAPSLVQRPSGFTIQHIRNIQSFYSRPKSQGGRGWRTGPHLFIDDDEIFGMCDFRSKGIHAASYNKRSLGIEVLGDYDTENPKTGRGLRCWKTAAATTSVLLRWLGIPKSASSILFHRDDPQTSKSCPGRKVAKDWFIDLVPDAIPSPPGPDEYEKPEVGIPWSYWHFAGEQWCVPLYAFLTAKGVPSDEVLANLRTSNGALYYGTELINGGFYVSKNSSPKPDESTWAPVRNLLEILES